MRRCTRRNRSSAVFWSDADDNVLISPSSDRSLIPGVLFSPLPVVLRQRGDQVTGDAVVRCGQRTLWTRCRCRHRIRQPVVLEGYGLAGAVDVPSSAGRRRSVRGLMQSSEATSGSVGISPESRNSVLRTTAVMPWRRSRRCISTSHCALDRVPEALSTLLGRQVPIERVGHHLAHAASVYHPFRWWSTAAVKSRRARCSAGAQTSHRWLTARGGRCARFGSVRRRG